MVIRNVISARTKPPNPAPIPPKILPAIAIISAASMAGPTAYLPTRFSPLIGSAVTSTKAGPLSIKEYLATLVVLLISRLV